MWPGLRFACETLRGRDGAAGVRFSNWRVFGARILEREGMEKMGYRNHGRAVQAANIPAHDVHQSARFSRRD